MKTAVLSKGTVKHALLSELARKQKTAVEAANDAGLLFSDYGRRFRELVEAGLCEKTDRFRDGRALFRITEAGREARSLAK